MNQLQQEISSNRSSLWFGALSFEERCIGSLVGIEEQGLKVTAGIAVEYPTKVNPALAAKERTDTHRDLLQQLGDDVFKNPLQFFKIEPYSFQDIQQTFQKVIESVCPDLVILDITCMTKIHALALASKIAEFKTLRVIIAYSIPENYASLTGKPRSVGWKDIIIAPLADTAKLLNETHSRGIIELGHEADRLVVGLAELEPSGGLILRAYNSQRPDLSRLSENLHRKIIRQLTSMRASNWTAMTVDGNHLDDIKAPLKREIEIAKKYEAPIILFPYGPKSLLFASAVQLNCDYPEASWFVYPIPTGYDVNYTEGFEKTIWRFSACTVETRRPEKVICR